MKEVNYNIVALVCVLGAILLASLGMEGWGWFLVAAILFYL